MPRGARLIVIYWRDIPAQVNASTRGEKHQVLLKPRFQKAIDRAAMVAGITRASDYVNEWRQVAVPLIGDPTETAQTEAARLEGLFPLERLDELVAAGGFDAAGTTSATESTTTESATTAPPNESPGAPE